MRELYFPTFDYYENQLPRISVTIERFPYLFTERWRLDRQILVLENMKDRNDAVYQEMMEGIKSCRELCIS